MPTPCHSYADCAFLERLNAQIEPHLSDADLNVTQLLRYVGMSRTNLHRKLVQTAGISATEYIRCARVKRAAKLLIEHPDWSIGQVSDEVGFNSQSYFTRAFIEGYQKSPSCYRKERLQMEFFNPAGKVEHL